MVAKAAKRAEPLMEAVAPVKIRVGGLGDVVVEARRRGRMAWEKLKAPFLEGGDGHYLLALCLSGLVMVELTRSRRSSSVCPALRARGMAFAQIRRRH